MNFRYNSFLENAVSNYFSSRRDNQDITTRKFVQISLKPLQSFIITEITFTSEKFSSSLALEEYFVRNHPEKLRKKISVILICMKLEWKIYTFTNSF